MKNSMKIKVSFFDKILLKNFFSILSVISLLMSFILISWNIDEEYQMAITIFLFIIIFIGYILLWIIANKRTQVNLSIKNSEIEIKIGDIFESEGLKVIAFNEYFDTIVDNKIISEKSLNGQFINKIINNIDEFDNLIDEDEHLSELKLEKHYKRKRGKKQKYELGSIFQYEEYLLTAFTKFDNDNRAYLSMNDYVKFLLNFWDEIDICYAGRSVSIPLLGSGITRFKEYDSITDQELLEVLIWSFKLSRIKFKHPSKATIVIHESKKDKINFYKLKEM